MSMYCQVCFKPLRITDKKTICSDACRQKRSRDKRDALKRAMDIGFTIDNWSKLLNDGVIEPEQARKLLDAVWDRLHTFYGLIQEKEQLARAAEEAAENASKKRKKRR